MEVKPRLQNAIAAHHIIQVVSAVIICILLIYKRALTSFLLLLMILISINEPNLLILETVKTSTNMSVQNDLLRAEMEVNPRLQTAIAVHHIIQVVSPVVIIIYEAASASFPRVLIIHIWAIGPIFLFIIFSIASKCSYQDLRLILVHFNPFLSTLWFLVFFINFITCLLVFGEIVSKVIVIITGFLSLSSAMFATYGIWKSARKVVLSARRVKRDHYDVLGSIPPTVELPDMYSEINVIRLSQANYIQPI